MQNVCRIRLVTSGVGSPYRCNPGMAYCPVFGCTSDSKKKRFDDIHLFVFPSGQLKEQQTRWKVWVKFCKHKAFKLTGNTRICSLHFADNAFDPAHSPTFLKSIACKDQTLVHLKKDAIPTLNKPLGETINKQRKASEKGTAIRYLMTDLFGFALSVTICKTFIFVYI